MLASIFTCIVGIGLMVFGILREGKRFAILITLTGCVVILFGTASLSISIEQEAQKRSRASTTP